MAMIVKSMHTVLILVACFTLLPHDGRHDERTFKRLDLKSSYSLQRLLFSLLSLSLSLTLTLSLTHIEKNKNKGNYKNGTHALVRVRIFPLINAKDTDRKRKLRETKFAKNLIS